MTEPLIPIRDFIESQLELLTAQIDALKELVTLKFTTLDTAVRLQAGEYERRLGELNHAHARAVETLATYVPREIYEANAKDTETRMRRLEIAQGAAENLVSYKRWFIGLVILLGVTLAFAFLSYLRGGAPLPLPDLPLP